MGAFGGFILTNDGLALQAKAQAGVQLNFTRVAVGDGDLSGQSISDLHALISEKMSLTINKFKTLPNYKAVVGANLSNQNVITGFYFKEWGVFAQDPDVGEILYCYTNAGAGAEYIAAGGGPTVIDKQIDCIAIASNATNVTATIDQSIIYVSNKGSVPSIQSGLDADKPLVGDTGAIYISTDTKIIYQDTGTAWEKRGVVNWGDIDGKPSAFNPTAHKSTHATGGSDALSPADIGAEPAFNKNTAFNKNFGNSAGTVTEGNDARLSDARTPTAHAASHASGGSDPITPGDIGAETPSNAQTKADNAEANAKTYTDGNFQALGSANTDINEIKSLPSYIDTRSLVVSRDTSNLVTKIDEKDNTTMVRSTSFTRTNGKISSIIEVVNGKTITYTINRDASGYFNGITKTVV